MSKSHYRDYFGIILPEEAINGFNHRSLPSLANSHPSGEFLIFPGAHDRRDATSTHGNFCHGGKMYVKAAYGSDLVHPIFQEK